MIVLSNITFGNLSYKIKEIVYLNIWLWFLERLERVKLNPQDSCNEINTWDVAAIHNLESDKLSFQGRLPIDPSTSNKSLIPDSHDPDFPMGDANNTNWRKDRL